MARVGNDTNGEDRNGYESIARLMDDHPECAIFRRFRELCAKMLLYRQAELLYDEDELKFASRCHKDDSEKKCFNHSWDKVLSSAGAEEFRKKGE